MRDSDAALEHLKVIRGLMEKATVYRTVTVPTALAGGFTAIITAAILIALDENLPSQTVLSVWLGVFALVNAFHHGLIWWTARRQGEPYPSTGLRMALKAIAPALFIGGILGLTAGYGPARDLIGAVSLWTTFYGLALMATSGFSPRSLRVLGLACTVTGGLLLAIHWGTQGGLPLINPQRTSALIMGLTFGLFHLVYGISVWSGQRAD